MAHIETIEYGNIELFSDVASIFEFYERLGLSSRLNAEDIKSPNSIRMCEEDEKTLLTLIKREARRRRKCTWGRNPTIPDGFVFWEQMMFGPMHGSKKGVLEIYSEK